MGDPLTAYFCLLFTELINLVCRLDHLMVENLKKKVV